MASTWFSTSWDHWDPMGRWTAMNSDLRDLQNLPPWHHLAPSGTPAGSSSGKPAETPRASLGLAKLLWDCDLQLTFEILSILSAVQQIFWHSWHYIRQISWCSIGYCTYSDILSGTLSDIYSGVFILHCIQHSIWHFYLTYNLTFYLALCGIRSDILSHSVWNFIWHSVQVWRGPESSRARGREAEYRRLARKPAMKLGAWRRGKQGRREGRGGRKEGKRRKAKLKKI